MPRKRSWTDEQLNAAVKGSHSVRMVIKKLGLIPAGGNYKQVQERIDHLQINIDHFTGKGWNVGRIFNPNPALPLDQILVAGRRHQSHSLKKRLYIAGLKAPICEICGWCKRSIDGRVPVELDHMNGDPSDNRLENLRILCPNCHSLQPTHRGLNKGARARREAEPDIIQ